ncbi:hypothetical protein KSS87_008707 [Heliosperma pusillum]|nr:hypothetical protein KSS87_008707 [Heliosperma pusillum]
MVVLQYFTTSYGDKANYFKIMPGFSIGSSPAMLPSLSMGYPMVWSALRLVINDINSWELPSYQRGSGWQQDGSRIKNN